MEALTGQKTNDRILRPAGDVEEYRESIRNLIAAEAKKALEEELRNAHKEILEEQRKAIRQILEENKSILRQVVEEEKKAVWAKAEAFRKALLKLDL